MDAQAYANAHKVRFNCEIVSAGRDFSSFFRACAKLFLLVRNEFIDLGLLDIALVTTPDANGEFIIDMVWEDHDSYQQVVKTDVWEEVVEKIHELPGTFTNVGVGVTLPEDAFVIDLTGYLWMHEHAREAQG